MNRDRAISAIGAAALQALLGWALLSGLAMSFGRAPEEALEVFAVAPEPPPPPPERIVPHRVRSEKREGRAAPPNRVSRATPVVAPTPVVVLPVPPPVVAAPVANTGAQATQGAALPGPGTGAGGVGDGTGSGGDGDGGGSGGLGRDIRLISGRVRMDDLPSRLFDALMGDPTDRIVGLRFLVGVKGRVTACEVTRSSGIRALDEATCDLIRRKLRYRPALDARGRPYPVEVTGEHEWLFRDAG